MKNGRSDDRIEWTIDIAFFERLGQKTHLGFRQAAGMCSLQQIGRDVHGHNLRAASGKFFCEIAGPASDLEGAFIGRQGCPVDDQLGPALCSDSTGRCAPTPDLFRFVSGQFSAMFNFMNCA